MNPPTAHQEQHQQQSQATVRLALWTAAWLLSMAIAVFGARFVWPDNTLVTGLFVLVNLIVGVGMILANKQHLRTLDELDQKIQLEAMGITLGVGFVVGFGYAVMDSTELLPENADVGIFAVIMSLTYLISVLLCSRKYR